jgi:hypothetical protein
MKKLFCAQRLISFLHSAFALLYSLDFHFAVRAGNPDLFRARLAGGFPIHGAADDGPHLGKPPAGAGTPVAGDGMSRPIQLQFIAVDAEFELFVVHSLPFIFDGILAGGVGQWLSNPEEKIPSSKARNRAVKGKNSQLLLKGDNVAGLQRHILTLQQILWINPGRLALARQNDLPRIIGTGVIGGDDCLG